MKRIISFGASLGLTLIMSWSAAASCDTRKMISAIGQNPIYLFGSDTKISCVGMIRAGARAYLIAYYDWNESDKHAKARGGFPHAAHRLLVFEAATHELKYLGFYGVDSAPLGISGNKIRFAHNWDGGEIAFGRGGPPAQSLIDGTPVGFSK